MNKVYIGDNKNVLKELIKNKEKVDIIYIDPPYNTKSKFTFKDNRNSDDWIRFMEERLVLSKEILVESGVLFISIDDNEVCNLKILCDKIYGLDNFLGMFITKQSQRSNSKHINTIHEYILVYAKNKKEVDRFEIKRMNNPRDRNMILDIERTIKREIEEKDFESAKKMLKKKINEYCKKYDITWLKNYNKIDDNGNVFFATDLSTPSVPRDVDIPEIGLKLKALPTRGWSSDKKFIELYKKNLLYFNNNRPYEIHYLKDSKDNVSSILDFYSRQGTEDLKRLGLSGIFDTAKPVELIKYLIRITSKDKDIKILDFFAGSGTTAQAVYEINKEDKKDNKYILVQIEEEVKTSKQRRICEEHNIRPVISEILKLRLEKYMTLNDIKDKVEVRYL